MEHLPLEIRDVDHIGVHQADRADARGGQIERRRRPQPAGADEQDSGSQELALPLLAHLAQQEVPAVALDLIGPERQILHDRQPGLDPLLVATLEIHDVAVAEVLERLGGEHRAQPRLTVENDRRLGIADHAAHAEFEKAAAHVRGRLDVAVAVFVGIAHVDEYGLAPRSQPPLHVERPLFRHHSPGLGQDRLERRRHRVLLLSLASVPEPPGPLEAARPC